MAPKKRFLLRLDPELYRRLEGWAADELRSVNGQIEFLMREALVRAGRTRGSGDLAELDPVELDPTEFGPSGDKNQPPK